MSITSVRTKLKSIVDGLVGSTGKPFKVAYDYFEPQPTGFPCAMVLWDNANETRLDSCTNEQNTTFKIRVLMTTKNSSAQETLRISVADSLLNAFRTSANVDTLGGTVEKFTLDDVSPISTDAERQYFYFELSITATKAVNIS
jgi:hypothetical protein